MFRLVKQEPLYVKMFRKNLYLSSRSFSSVWNPISSDVQNSLKPAGFFPNTEEVLASKLALVLQDSSDQSVLQQGRQVHAQFILNGINHLGLIGTRILGVYVLCGRFIDAKKVFYQLNLFFASPWNWMIRGFTMLGYFDLALLFYFKMLGCGTNPDKYTFPYVIKACGGLNAVNLVKSIHKTIQLVGFETDMFVGSALIKLYAENGCIVDARQVFDKLPHRDSILWNAMLNGYVKYGDTANIVHLFREMRITETKPNSVTYACILSACASEEMISLGTQLHGLVNKHGLETNSRVTNTLLSLYAKCHYLSEARKLFDMAQQTDLVTWNSMIGGYVQNGFMLEASDLFHEMISVGVKPDTVTFASFIPFISESGMYNQGKEINGYIIRHGVHLDVFLKNALIDMYFKCRDVDAAWNIFNYSTAVDIVICTAMISGYVLNGMNSDALAIFRWLLHEKMKPNVVTLASFLPACAGLAAVKLGKELHGYALKNGLEGHCYVGSAVTDMYAKCGRLDLARNVFVKISDRDAVCWNSMITSCSQNGEPEEAIDLFRQMRTEGLKYDGVSISAALSACANLPALHYGKEIHCFMTRGEFSSDVYAYSALIDMYAKCGALELAHHVFDVMPNKNEVSWSSIIAAYGNHGRLNECLSLFNQMKEAGFNPDHITFLAILSACGHVGHVQKGELYFTLMTQEHAIQARMEHYACMVDLFGRAGRLEDAYAVIKSMPFEADTGVWGTLLGACRVHGNVELAEVAARHLFTIDPQNSGYYVLLSNVQADSGKWEGVLETRKMMKERGVCKIPGYSWIEVNNQTHMFYAADTSHVRSEEIYVVLNHLLQELRKEGYVPCPYLPLHPQCSGL